MDYRAYIDAILPHLGTLIGFGLAFVLIARLMREKRRPSNTFAWLLVIVLAPYIGVPLFLLFGGRKIARLTRNKESLSLISDTTAKGTISVSPFGLITRGNRSSFLHTGIDAFKTLIREIQEAKESIDIATFILSHDAIGRRIVKELSKKSREGVEVRLLLDAVGSFGKKTLYMLELEKAGGRIERFMPVLPIWSWGRANLRNHRKIACFDRKRAIIGGRNIGRDYMGPTVSNKRWKDFGVLIEGPAVMQLSAIFEADWKFACSKNYNAREMLNIDPLENVDTGEIEIMASGPDTKGDPLYEKILSAIHEADEELTLVTPYYLPDEVLQRSLIVKARTGKRVKLIVPRKSNHPVTDLARQHYLRELHEAGVEVLLFDDGMMHGKGLLADGKVAMTGSVNIDLRSLFVNYEVAAFFYSPSDVSEVVSWIRMLEEKSIGFQESYDRKSSLAREIAEDLSRLLTPLL